MVDQVPALASVEHRSGRANPSRSVMPPLYPFMEPLFTGRRRYVTMGSLVSERSCPLTCC
jgi:hypothetical protein